MADFDAHTLTLSGLLQIDLPERTIRLCDGGFVRWGADKFESSDEIFGSITGVDTFNESVGDEAPSGSLTFAPNADADPAELNDPAYQGSRMRFWFARVDEAAGTIMGDPELVADCMLDTTALRLGSKLRELGMEFVGQLERLMSISEGHVLSDRFHQSIWPGETGLRNTTGVGKPVAWGAESPVSRGTAGYGGSGFVGYASSAVRQV